MGLYNFFRGIFGKATTGYEVEDRVQTNQMPHVPRPQVASKELSSMTRNNVLGLSRHFFRNDGTIRELVGNLALYSVGTGITPQPMTSSTPLNDEILSKFEKWWNKPEVTGRFSGRQVQKFISTSYDTDGEIFIIKTYDPITNEPKIQLIEAQQVKSSEDYPDFEAGIKFDEYGKPVAYCVEQQNGTYKIVPADSVIHVFNAERATSTRGISTYTHLLSLTNQRIELLDLTIQKARQEARFVNAIEQSRADDSLSVSDYLNCDASDVENQSAEQERMLFESANRVSSVIGGTTVSLPSGMTLKQLSNNTPGNTYLGFAEQLLKLSSCGLMPYGFADPSGLTGVSVRMVIAKAARVIGDRQDLICEVMTEIYRYFVGWLLSESEMVLDNITGLLEVSWQCPRSVTVDYGRDERTDLALLESGVKPIEDYFAERGLDFKTELKKRLEAIEQIRTECEHKGINPEEAYPSLFKVNK